MSGDFWGSQEGCQGPSRGRPMISVPKEWPFLAPAWLLGFPGRPWCALVCRAIAVFSPSAITWCSPSVSMFLLLSYKNASHIGGWSAFVRVGTAVRTRHSPPHVFAHLLGPALCCTTPEGCPGVHTPRSHGDPGLRTPTQSRPGGWWTTPHSPELSTPHPHLSNPSPCSPATPRCLGAAIHGVAKSWTRLSDFARFTWAM